MQMLISGLHDLSSAFSKKGFERSDQWFSKRGCETETSLKRCGGLSLLNPDSAHSATLPTRCRDAEEPLAPLPSRYSTVC